MRSTYGPVLLRLPKELASYLSLGRPGPEWMRRTVGTSCRSRAKVPERLDNAVPSIARSRTGGRMCNVLKRYV